MEYVFPTISSMLLSLFSEGTLIWWSDHDKILGSKNTKDSFTSLEVGSDLKDEITDEVFSTKKPITRNVDWNGTPTVHSVFPIYDWEDENLITGSIGINITRLNSLRLQRMSNKLNTSLDQSAAAIEELAASASEISTNETILNKNIKEVYQLSDSINDVLAFIKQIADETKMLGLNAAIEAARVGELGRGFGVVAEEIRKLSDQSRETVNKIHEFTENIKSKINETSKNGELTLRASEEQAAAAQEMASTVQEITEMAAKLVKLAERI
jgi:methyl-accepting chemotaxis protein